MTKISVIGTGYVGLVTGTCFAEMGHTVTCIDIDMQKINTLSKGQIPFYEPGLEELIHRNTRSQRLQFSTDYAAISQSTLIFLAVGTPEGDNGSPNMQYLTAATISIAHHLSTSYTVIVNKTTSPIGTVNTLYKLLQDHAPEHALCDVVSCPEFLKEGSAVSDCMKPDRIIIGSNSQQATTLLKKLYAPFTLNSDRILTMDIPSAELTKYASNAMLATRISFMNNLSLLCEQVGANINHVRTGMSTDTRIGSHFLYAGIGYGGSCFPKDIRALSSLLKAHNCDSSLLDAVDTINSHQIDRFIATITTYFQSHGGIKGKTLAIWGLSFKPNTDDIREAPSLICIKALHQQGAHLNLYDPVAIKSSRQSLNLYSNITFCDNEYQAASQADAILLITEWKQFRVVDLKTIHTIMKGNAFFDGRNQYHPQEMADHGFDYMCIGIRSDNQPLTDEESSHDKQYTTDNHLTTCTD